MSARTTGDSPLNVVPLDLDKGIADVVDEALSSVVPEPIGFGALEVDSPIDAATEASPSWGLLTAYLSNLLDGATVGSIFEGSPSAETGHCGFGSLATPSSFGFTTDLSELLNAGYRPRDPPVPWDGPPIHIRGNSTSFDNEGDDQVLRRGRVRTPPRQGRMAGRFPADGTGERIRQFGFLAKGPHLLHFAGHGVDADSLPILAAASFHLILPQTTKDRFVPLRCFGAGVDTLPASELCKLALEAFCRNCPDDAVFVLLAAELRSEAFMAHKMGIQEDEVRYRVRRSQAIAVPYFAEWLNMTRDLALTGAR